MVFDCKIKDDDIFDRLNHRYTLGLLILFSILITVNQQSSDRLTCLSSRNVTIEEVKYINKYCWSLDTLTFQNENTVHLNLIKDLGLFLLALAFIVYSPRVLWNMSGVNVWNLMHMSVRYQFGDLQTQTYCMEKMSSAIESNEPETTFSRFINNYPLKYFIIKFFYIMNMALQIVMLSLLLGESCLIYWFSFFKMLFTAGSIDEDKYFPEKVQCNYHGEQIPCLLSTNNLNQQIFVIISFWYFMLVLIAFFNILKWIFELTPHKYNKNWIKKFVDANVETVDKLNLFASHYSSKANKLFLIRMIYMNTDKYVVRELIQEIWNHFNGIHHARNQREPLTKKMSNIYIPIDNIQVVPTAQAKVGVSPMTKNAYQAYKNEKGKLKANATYQSDDDAENYIDLGVKEEKNEPTNITSANNKLILQKSIDGDYTCFDQTVFIDKPLENKPKVKFSDVTTSFN